jgi:ABC-type molybdate transport system permease subunit
MTDFLVQAFIYLLAAVITVPLAKRFGLGSVLGYLLAGVVIGPPLLGVVKADAVKHFAEFGVVMMIGGSIPGQTRVVSTQIYGHVEAMEYAQAHWLAGGMLVFSFVVLLAAGRLQRRNMRIGL